MPDHSIHNLTRPGFQATGGGVPHRPDGESESAWLMLDAVGGRVAFVQPGNAADQVRVAVHEAGHHHPSGGVYLVRVARLREILDAPAGTDFHDAPVLHQQCAIANDAEFFERWTPPGLPGSVQGYQLPRPSHQHSSGHSEELVINITGYDV